MKSLPIPPHRVCLLLALALFLAGCAAGGQEAPTPTPVPQVVSQEKIVFTVEKGPIISKRNFYGEVVPAKQEPLFFRAPGYINRVTVKDGDRVKKGDVMAELQIDDLLSQLEQARIDLQTAQDNLESEKLQQEYPSDLKLLAINLEEPLDQVRDYVSRQNIRSTVLLDSEGKVGRAYGSESIPMQVIIDKKGIVRDVLVGFSPRMTDRLRGEIAKLRAD